MIRQLLVVRYHDGATDVFDFADDQDAALKGYARMEAALESSPSITHDRPPHRTLRTCAVERRAAEVCLFGADTVATLKRTHSSWFNGKTQVWSRQDHPS